MYSTMCGCAKGDPPLLTVTAKPGQQALLQSVLCLQELKGKWKWYVGGRADVGWDKANLRRLGRE